MRVAICMCCHKMNDGGGEGFKGTSEMARREHQCEAIPEEHRRQWAPVIYVGEKERFDPSSPVVNCRVPEGDEVCDHTAMFIDRANGDRETCPHHVPWIASMDADFERAVDQLPNGVVMSIKCINGKLCLGHFIGKTEAVEHMLGVLKQDEQRGTAEDFIRKMSSHRRANRPDDPANKPN